MIGLPAREAAAGQRNANERAEKSREDFLHARGLYLTTG
jgi:hypothetical protein